MKKIQLIKAPLDDGYPQIDQWYFPLDLLHLAYAVDINKFEVEILDGTHYSLTEILERLDAHSKFIGISYSALSITSLSRIATAAKEKGLFVVVGGQAATADRNRIVKGKNVDAVVVGDGEEAIRVLSEIDDFTALSLSKVPNLLFNNGLSFEQNKILSNDLSNKMILPRDLGGISPEQYLTSYNKNTHTLSNISANRPTNIYSKRGCNRTCSFCARVDKKLRLRRPEDVISEITTLVDKYGVDYIIDTSDTWVVNNWLDQYKYEYLKRVPSKLRMMIFADVRDITSEICSDMKMVGIDNVLLGIESGSERILANNMKSMTRKNITDAVRSLTSHGIKVSASFVVGLIDEDRESLRETQELFEELHFIGANNVKCYCNVVIPLPGSYIWAKMVEKLGDNHIACESGFNYNIENSRKAVVEYLANVDGGVSTLEAFRDKMLDFSGLRILEYAR